MKNSKRILTIILCLTLIFSTIACLGVSAGAIDVPERKCKNKGCNSTLAVHYHPETCTTDGYYEYVCTNIACTGYSEFNSIDKRGHGKQQGTVDVITVVPTCTTAGVKETICKDCGVVINAVPISATGHTAGAWVVTQEPTATTKGEKVQYCSKCGVVMGTQEIAQHTHTAGDTVVVRAATCTQSGVSGTMCSVCSAVYSTSAIAAKGHSEPVYATNVPATCTTAGEDNGYCTDCGMIIATKASTALGHDSGVVITSTAPTCTVNGESSTVCTRCGETIATAPIAALGHDAGVETVAIEPTCELKGEKRTTCTRCGDIIATAEIAALGHDNGYWAVDYEPTPEHEEGRMSRYCSRCDMILETKEFSAHTHTKGYEKVLIPETCTDDGQLGIFCAYCGVCYDVAVIPSSKHNYGPWYVDNNKTHSCSCDKCGDIKTENCTFDATVTAATCTSYGYTTNVCAFCGFTYVDKIVAPLGHDWSEWVDNKDGVTHTRTCKRTDCTADCCEGKCEGGCKASETDIHKWSKWIFNNDNKLCKNGTMTRHCGLCGATQTVICPKSSKLNLFFLKVVNSIRSIFGLKVIVIIDPNTGIVVDNDIVVDSDSNIDSDSDSNWIS